MNHLMSDKLNYNECFKMQGVKSLLQTLAAYNIGFGNSRAEVILINFCATFISSTGRKFFDDLFVHNLNLL